MQLSTLRTQFPRFYYHSAQYQLTAVGLEVNFEFSFSPTHRFSPGLVFHDINQSHLSPLSPEIIQAYVFNLGLVEMLSYWKAACSPEIVIEAGKLTQDQVEWWHHLLINGMGEFFFVNQIEFTQRDFVTLISGEQCSTGRYQPAKTSNSAPPLSSEAKILIPIGGGKDSVVTLELLKQFIYHRPQLGLLHLNPTVADSDTARVSEVTTLHYVTRQLDPLILELNADGFLNGHTPFSALLAFVSTFMAHLTGYSYVALSNERSSNEGNVWYQDMEINHQYSKSFEFELAFQDYASRYFPGSPWYFSLLRPWYEMQIARVFAQYPLYHHIFRSCNRGKKTNSWCGECSKCLFAYSIIFPFIGSPQLTENFGSDMLAKVELLPLALELMGRAEHKPLECIGTIEESTIAFALCWQWYQDQGLPTPALLQAIYDQVLVDELNLGERAHQLKSAWNDQHSLPAELSVAMEEL